MPEGHILHRLAAEHHRDFGGQTVSVSSPQGRFSEEAALLDGRVFDTAEAWGKHLLHRYRDDAGGPDGPMVHIHLGIYGAFTHGRVPLGEPVGQVRMRIEGPEWGTDLRGPAACELYTPADLDALLDRLGPDPLRDDADPGRAWEMIRRSRRSIGAMLMDQRVMAGVGNVYRAEVLFRAGISPYREGRHLDRAEFDELWTDLVELMKVGRREGLMHVIRPEDDFGAPAYAPNRPRTYVYRRAGESCRVCGTPVSHAVVQGRNLFWCEHCQR